MTIDPTIPLLYVGSGREDLGTAIHHARWTSKLCEVPMLFVYGGEVLCIEPHHTEAAVLEAWATSRHMARRDP